MLKHEAGLSHPQGGARSRHHPKELAGRAVGRVPRRWSAEPPGFHCAKSEAGLRWVQFLGAQRGRPAPSGLCQPMTAPSGHSLTRGHLWSTAW